MLAMTGQCGTLAGVRIAVHTAIWAGIVHSNIAAGDTATLIARGVRSGTEGVVGEERGQQIAVYTVRLVDAPVQQCILAAGVQLDPDRAVFTGFRPKPA
jgi:hypothetical protein